MDTVARHIRDVFAACGVALYQAQCLERQLAICLATDAGPGPSRMTQRDYDELLEQLFHETLGQLRRRLENAACPPDVAEDLRDCLQKRNWLTHHYFWDHAAAFNTPDGRADMISELHALAADFERLDACLTAINKAWAHAVGITDEDFADALANVLASRPDYFDSRYLRTTSQDPRELALYTNETCRS